MPHIDLVSSALAPGVSPVGVDYRDAGAGRPIVWGHSNGAVIALPMWLSHPARLSGLIVEAAHLFRKKPSSRRFVETDGGHSPHSERATSDQTARIAKRFGRGLLSDPPALVVPPGPAGLPDRP